MAKTGRPSIFTQELADTICERLANGESLKAICEDDDMPDRWTVWKWDRDNHEGFSHKYARAREHQGDHYFDQCLEVADGKGVAKGRDPQERRLMFDARRWMAGKLKGKYSDKVKHVGGDEDDPVIKTETRLDMSKLSDDQLRALSGIEVPTK